MVPRRHLTLLLAGLGLVATVCGDAGTSTSAPPAPSTTAAASTVPATIPPAATSAPPATAVRPATGPGPGGEVVIGLEGDLGTLNPFAAGDTEHLVAVVGQLHLVGISDVDAELRRAPEVVEELPTVDNGGVEVNPDGTTTVRYAIREEAVWADGTPISGDDFAFTLDGAVRRAGGGAAGA